MFNDLAFEKLVLAAVHGFHLSNFLLQKRDHLFVISRKFRPSLRYLPEYGQLFEKRRGARFGVSSGRRLAYRHLVDGSGGLRRILPHREGHPDHHIRAAENLFAQR